MESTTSQASILIVDDDPGSRVALRELLEGPGQEVILADSGEEALRRILKRDFAVILLDVRMPGMDGFETARLVRERKRSRHTPIIFMTGAYEDVRSEFRGYEAGAVDYIAKPLVAQVLKSKISVFLELYKINADLRREIAVRTRAEEHLRASEENLRSLAAHLQSVREEEWTRIAREIHDELGQALTGLKMDLTWVTKRLRADQKPLAEKTGSMSRLIDDTVQLVRQIASRLRPAILEQRGLTAAIWWQARDFRKRVGIRCEVSVPADAPQIDKERSLAAFRVFQELLTNIARHAEATRAEITLRVEPDMLVLSVEDNGKGIDEAAASSPKSLGFMGMRERILPFGGKIEIAGLRNAGTRVRVSIPLDVK
jgi:signal transduction histidine kinase